VGFRYRRCQRLFILPFSKVHVIGIRREHKLCFRCQLKQPRGSCVRNQSVLPSPQHKQRESAHGKLGEERLGMAMPHEAAGTRHRSQKAKARSWRSFVTPVRPLPKEWNHDTTDEL
jgi:hypothetical protein